MNTWIIEPRDSLIVRDGRPFGLGAGTQAMSLDFPFPSTTTGGLRTRAGLDSQGIFDVSLISTVKEIGVRGPLLIELSEQGEISDWLMPAPSDALLTRDESNGSKTNIKRLAPIKVNSDWTNLENGLSPVGVGSSLKGKPSNDAPRYWRWENFKQWLIRAEDQPIDVGSLGHGGPKKDSRVHVAIDPESFTSGEGELFQTHGLEFRQMPGENKELNVAKRLALVVFVDDNARTESINEGLAPLGGERRLVVWRKGRGEKINCLSQCPNEVTQKIIEAGFCRLILLTPASFKQGSYPERLLRAHSSGITAKLKAIAHNRYQVVSGWDFEIDRPKPTRRLVPSGSVLFLELEGAKENRSKWIEDTWLSCISDTETENKDGFGLAVLGTWDGNYLSLE